METSEISGLHISADDERGYNMKWEKKLKIFTEWLNS